ncbi:hypothetical protein [Spirosoma flavum]|uniref:Universal stress protein n=1 Tax=Spirosoma flavum TaxID=2048557 RepID=A0ABW6AUI7_9BACT
MKTALFLTDGSVDSALSLRRWLSIDPKAAIRLTVVHPYDIELGTTLTKITCRAAKQQAVDRLENWLDLLPQLWSGEFKTETLLATPELAATIHLLLRPYTYLLVDDQAFGLPVNSDALINTSSAKICRLGDHSLALLS